jgi:hypothetical protein
MSNALGLKAHHITGQTRDIETVQGLPGYAISFVQFEADVSDRDRRRRRRALTQYFAMTTTPAASLAT